LNILFVASEATPLAKTGGLADVVGSLPKELARQGHDVRIVIPLYRQTASAARRINFAGITVEVPCGKDVEEARLFESTIGSVPVYLVAHDGYFDRDHLYGDPDGDYPDNDRRFSFFCRAVLALMERVGFCPDILHCHDWQTAIIPVILHAERDAHPFFRRTATVYTIHNLAYQGLFPPASLTTLGIAPALFTMEGLEFYGRVNLMKGGILYADSVTTVSPTYREEILTPEQGCGLEGVLRAREGDLHGILNGLDYEVWNPATDPGIVADYTTPEGKGANKRELQTELGLDVDPDIPVLAMISRLAAQKGFDLVAKLLPSLLRRRLQLVIVGVGDAKYLRLLRRFHRLGLPNLAISLDFAPLLAPKVYAGSDIFLMPSHYEPCGLGQLIALRYGTVPVVRSTGGLADTVVDPAENAAAANGFSFADYSTTALCGAIDRALAAYGDRPYWRELVARGMTRDFSWGRSAELYAALYRETLDKKRGSET
jgi:starch synthase